MLRYSYDGDLLTSVTYPNGGSFKYSYDEAGRILSVCDLNGKTYVKNTYDRDSRVTRQAMITGGEYVYFYDPQNRLTTYTEVHTGQRLTVHYNRQKLVEAIDYPEGTVEERGYDAWENQVYKKDRLGSETRWEFNAQGQLLQEIKADGLITTHTYDKQGQRIRTQDNLGGEICYNADGHKIRTHYPDGGVARCFYDAEGNLIKEVRPNQYDKATDDGAGTTYTYDGGNRCTSITDAVGNLVESSRYDAKGRCIYHQDAGQLEARREGMVYATTYRYDLAGNKLEERKAVSEKDGAIQYSLRRWTYDIHNNITEEKTWLTLQSENSASGLTRTICNTYDKQNRLIRVTDNLGAEVKYTYNSIGKRTSEERKVNAEETQLIKYLYDEIGRLTDRAEKLNQKRKGTWWAHTRYAYDANSNIIEIQFPNGSKIQRDYDAVDRLIAETVIDHASGQKNTTNFAYDKAGNIVNITDDCGRNEQFTYNLMNQRTQEISSEGRTQNLVYDK